MARQQLVKATITVLEGAEKGTVIAALFNPSEYSFERSNAYKATPVPGLGAPLLEVYPSTGAAARLSNPICIGDEKIRAVQQETLERFLSLPLWRMRYSEAESVEPALRALFDRVAERR